MQIRNHRGTRGADRSIYIAPSETPPFSYSGSTRMTRGIIFSQPADLKMPSLSLMNESVTKVDDGYAVTVIWSEDDCTSHDVQYILSVSKQTSPEIMNYPTNLTQMNLTLSEGIEYTLTVNATLCRKSVTSNKLPLKFGGTSIVAEK